MTDDERQILDILASYCVEQDSGDVRAVSELFRHAHYRVHNGESHFGFDEVFALKSKHNKIHDDGTLRTKHLTTNTIIEHLPGQNVARTRSYFVVLQATDQLPLQPVIAGRYHDLFEKVDGRWRLRDRLIFGDLRGDLTNHLRDNPLDRK